MNTFQFATCDRGRALHFLGKLFPSKKLNDTGAVSSVLDLVEADKIRVLDPDFHAGAISQSKATDQEWQDAQPILQKMVSEIESMPSFAQAA